MITACLQNAAKTPMPSALVFRGLLQRKCACGGSAGVVSECDECNNKKLSLQRSTEGSHTESRGSLHVPPIVNDVLNSSGEPLDTSAREFMEPRFGHDFSRVRVHTDANAAESARAVQALAYTVGRDVMFAAGQYAPNSPAGRKLLAHELTHVVQQGGGAPLASQNLAITYPSDSAEREADSISEKINQPNPVSTKVQIAPTIARQDDAGAPEPEPDDPGLQVECVKRLGGCASTRPGGLPTPEEIERYNAECRRETGYSGPDVTPTDEECRTSGPPPVTPTTVFMCSKSLERSPLGTHAFFRVGGSGTGRPTYSLEPENRGSDCWQGEPKRNFPADFNAAANCERTSIALSCLDAQYAAYPIGHYCTWGPNSNTFVGHIARNCGMSNPDPPGWNPGIDASPPPSGTFAPSPDSTLWGCETKECSR
jgi:hypothetical protein